MEFVQFLGALLILATTAAVVLGPPAVFLTRHRRRRERDTRAWRDAATVALWEPTVESDDTWSYRNGPHVAVEIRKVARRVDTNAERVLERFHITFVYANDTEFDRRLQDALGKARDTCAAMNGARFAA
jgi:hypothetical protein